jgi:predicted phosphodiesterase
MDNENTQTLVLAGDICPLIDLHLYESFFTDCVTRFKEVWYVYGNHEWYGADFKMEENFKHRLCLLGVLVKDGYSDGVFATTLWTNYNNDPIAEQDAFFNMSDFKVIKNQHNKLVVSDIVTRHYRAVGLLKLCKPEIVITHHSPSFQGVSERFKRHALNPAFHSNLDELIELVQPRLWIHGHTHDSLDYMIGQTRIICNPKGYGSENKKFSPFLTIQV